MSMETITAHGMHMAKLGLGTWQMRDEACTAAVAGALQMGYRHIDTAEMYGNEEAVGTGIHRGGVPRDDIHLTSKVWWEHLTPTAMVAAIDATLGRLSMDYVDLYLVHWPAAGMDLPAVMDSLEAIRESGKARAIGVANFPSALLKQAVATGAPIACNQVEYHVLLSQDRLLETMRPLGIPLVAYSPLAKGGLVEHAALREIAAKHGATPAQVALKWLLDQPGVAAIPKASRPESQRANLEALRLTLDDADRAAIAALPKGERSVNPGFAPAWD
jgi:2,5-diketo-D-gluconate reductase B